MYHWKGSIGFHTAELVGLSAAAAGVMAAAQPVDRKKAKRFSRTGLSYSRV